jgi:flagellar operon protein
MALEKMTGGAAGLNSIQPTQGLKSPVGQSADSAPNAAKAAEFKSALGQALTDSTKAGVNTSKMQMPGALATNAVDGLKFSNHAIERMHSRGISFSPETMKDIQGAITKASQKGAKDTLVLAGDNALIVSVKNNTVVTVMDRAAMKDNVFTNIDSTVVV